MPHLRSRFSQFVAQLIECHIASGMYDQAVQYSKFSRIELDFLIVDEDPLLPAFHAQLSEMKSSSQTLSDRLAKRISALMRFSSASVSIGFLR